MLATAGVNSRPVSSVNMETSQNRWGSSINPEDLKDPENGQNIHDEALTGRGTRSVPEMLGVAQNRYRGTRWGRSVILDDQDLKVEESRYKKRRPAGNYGGHTGAFRKGRSVIEDLEMAASRNRRPGGHYSKTRWGR